MKSAVRRNGHEFHELHEWITNDSWLLLWSTPMVKHAGRVYFLTFLM